MSREISVSDPFLPVTGFALIDTLLARRFDAFGDAFAHLILPALTLAAYPAGIAMRLTRSAMIEIWNGATSWLPARWACRTAASSSGMLCRMRSVQP